jgi:hypothetical protein
MIRNNSAALIVSSTINSISGVSALLDLEPTLSHELGEETRNSGRVPPGSPRRFHKDSRWVFGVEDDASEDETGFGSVRKLLDSLKGRETAVRALHPDFEVWMQWTGFSDSESGGFVIPADVLPSLASLECDIVANAEFDVSG